MKREWCATNFKTEHSWVEGWEGRGRTRGALKLGGWGLGLPGQSELASWAYMAAAHMHSTVHGSPWGYTPIPCLFIHWTARPFLKKQDAVTNSFLHSIWTYVLKIRTSDDYCIVKRLLFCTDQSRIHAQEDHRNSFVQQHGYSLPAHILVVTHSIRWNGNLPNVSNGWFSFLTVVTFYSVLLSLSPVFSVFD